MKARIALIAMIAASPIPIASGQSSTSYCATYVLPAAKETAAFYNPMTYRYVNGPTGRILLAEGKVKPGESGRLLQMLNSGGSVEEIWLNSPGGNAVEGPKMGRVIRQKGLAVRLKTQHACISACSYAFLSGAIRIVEPGAHYGVHMFSGAGDTSYMLAIVAEAARLSAARTELVSKGNKPSVVDAAVANEMGKIFSHIQQEAAQTAAIRARYLVEMSLSLDFMTDAFGTKAENVCYLSPIGLRHYNVSNAR